MIEYTFSTVPLSVFVLLDILNIMKDVFCLGRNRGSFSDVFVFLKLLVRNLVLIVISVFLILKGVRFLLNGRSFLRDFVLWLVDLSSRMYDGLNFVTQEFKLNLIIGKLNVPRIQKY